MSSPLLALENVTRVFAMGEERISALGGVSFDVKAGECVALVGTSGSGKSTLLGILGCLDRPTGGTYRLKGRDVQTLSDDECSALRNQEIGFIFQSFQLLPRASAWKNVALPLMYRGVPARERKERAIACLERVGLGHRLDHRPTQLSGGQRQRVAIARALVGGPSLLLADEPTGNLDTATGEEIMRLFEALHAEGNTVLIVTHEPSIAARCPRAIRLVDGKVLADGPGRLVAESIRRGEARPLAGAA
jgi:putative ABC transport system ATP-binding protein